MRLILRSAATRKPLTAWLAAGPLALRVWRTSSVENGAGPSASDSVNPSRLPSGYSGLGCSAEEATGPFPLGSPDFQADGAHWLNEQKPSGTRESTQMIRPVLIAEHALAV